MTFQHGTESKGDFQPRTACPAKLSGEGKRITFR